MKRVTRRDVLKYGGSGLITGLLGSSTAAGALDESIFVHGAGGSQSRAIAAVGDHRGSIIYEYNNFDFVAARVPRESVDNLGADARVARVEGDSVVFLANSTEIGSTENKNVNGNGSGNGNGNGGDGGGSGGCSTHPDQRTSWGYDRANADVVTEATGAGVAIGILDTGIQTDHCDLTVAGGTNFSNGNPDDYTDDNGHGTHVAGIVGADDNSIGTIGVAPDSTLWSVRVLDRSGSGRWSDVAAGIDWCLSNGVEIVSISIGGSYNESVATAISQAYDAGHLVVCSAGNEGNDEDGNCEENNVLFPATHPDTIAVVGMDEDTQFGTLLGEYSSLGAAIDIMAPGTNIRSTYVGNDYRRMTGTSMAAPHVTGVASLVWEAMDASLSDEDGDSATGEPNDEVREILLTTAETALGTCEEGAGLVDAAAAVEEAATR